jgi:hypothetical protein
MAGSRYVNVPASALLAVLADICIKVEGAGGSANRGTHGREVVYDLQHKDAPAFVRVYTSLAEGDSSVRGCGEDAVRLVIGATVDGKFKPLAKSRRIYRTAPQGPEEKRVEVFLDRLTQALREGYASSVRDFPRCPRCGSPMARRKAKAGGEFFGCARFPECRATKNITSNPRPPEPEQAPARETVY